MPEPIEKIQHAFVEVTDRLTEDPDDERIGNKYYVREGSSFLPPMDESLILHGVKATKHGLPKNKIPLDAKVYVAPPAMDDFVNSATAVYSSFKSIEMVRKRIAVEGELPQLTEGLRNLTDVLLGTQEELGLRFWDLAERLGAGNLVFAGLDKTAFRKTILQLAEDGEDGWVDQNHELSPEEVVERFGSRNPTLLEQIGSGKHFRYAFEGEAGVGEDLAGLRRLSDGLGSAGCTDEMENIFIIRVLTDLAQTTENPEYYADEVTYTTNVMEKLAGFIRTYRECTQPEYKRVYKIADHPSEQLILDELMQEHGQE